MTNITELAPRGGDVLQRARAGYLWRLLEDERWTYRKLEARTGINKSVLSSRMRGVTPVTMGELEIFAEVLRRNPVELYAELLAIGPEQHPQDYKVAVSEVVHLATFRESRRAG